jgi:LacI family transcriptional regulator
MASEDRIARRPTLADVAAAAGVSPATASRALGNGTHVSVHTRERVWAAAERLSFQPNRLARSLRRGSTMAVGLVIPDVATAFYGRVMKGAQEVLEAAGYHVLVVNTGRAAGREREAVRSLRSHQVDGLIIATYGGYEDIGVPVVFFDDVLPEVGVGAIAMANAEGIGLLFDHLARTHGHRKIAYIGPPDSADDGATPPVFTARERVDGFRAAAGRARLPLPPEYVRFADPRLGETAARDAGTELLRLADPPTAIVAATDIHAIGVLHAARAAGVVVPGDLALVSFDEPAYADLLEPPMTSLDRHDSELGHRAAELLLVALEGAGPVLTAGAGVLRVSLELRVRRSCGCPA